MNIALQPVKLGGVTVPNRIFRPAHQIHMCRDGRVTERFIAYHEARARGGTGLIILEAAPVHTSSAERPDTLTIWDDEAIEGLTRVRERLASYGTRVFIQLWHGGHNAYPADGSPPWSASSSTGFWSGVPSIEMTKGMIDEIVHAYARAAERAAAAGLDGVEIHASHGYLPRQFLAEALNWRTDEYGGPFENRVRFLVEVMRAVRSAVPEGFAVGPRVGPDVLEGLSDLEENQRVIAILERERLIDFFNTTVGDYVISDLVAAGMHEPSGYQRAFLKDSAQQSSVPMLMTGRFRTIEEAAEVIRNGQAAMIGMVRAQLADPEIVIKTKEGRVDEIRPCIACNQRCVAGIPTGNIGCAVNPAAGHEIDLGAHRLMRVSDPKRVVVIGGGVAGMEAARVAATRGHAVELYEAQADLGGTVRFVSKRAPKMGAFGDITYWQESELRRLGVDIRTNSYVEATDFNRAEVDVFVVATGSYPKMDAAQRHRPGVRVKGADRKHVVSPLDLLMMTRERLGKTAVVLDNVGHYEGIAAAEYLIQEGVSVTYLSRFPTFAPLMEWSQRAAPAYRRLCQTGRFTFRAQALLREILESSVVNFDPTIQIEPENIPADLVVLVGYNSSNNALSFELQATNSNVMTIGDALSARYIESAIRDGFLTGINI
jgi:2,4-dienoyl-CoA reductase-like NADH-dependent reductase (Old Yellow Enzyme family)